MCNWPIEMNGDTLSLRKTLVSLNGPYSGEEKLHKGKISQLFDIRRGVNRDQERKKTEFSPLTPLSVAAEHQDSVHIVVE